MSNEDGLEQVRRSNNDLDQVVFTLETSSNSNETDSSSSDSDTTMEEEELGCSFETGSNFPFHSSNFNICSSLTCISLQFNTQNNMDFGGCSITTPTLFWNCRGLDQVTTVQLLTSLVTLDKPDIIFLCETMCSKVTADKHLSRLKFPLSFGFDAIGKVEVFG
ncbi:hypothetical protein LIER_08006 [Lithospermum erythrorhizon]|uniref:Uncharacterized protein n=1 Tax=Lithospermum erythrorhizon TaxID=34254 RepID=A0AAV3PCC9_LITER